MEKIKSKLTTLRQKKVSLPSMPTMPSLPLLKRDRDTDPEFCNVKQKLANVATALDDCVAGLYTAENNWRAIYTGMKKFSHNFYTLYPSDDEVRRLGKATLKSTQGLVDEVENDGNILDERMESIHVIDRVIKAYLAEIRTLQKEFKNVTSAKNDFSKAKNRLERYENGKRVDPDRRAVFADNLHDRERTYQCLLEGLTNRLASTYDKHSQVFQAAYVAYWLRVDYARDLMDRHLKSHREYAKKLEKDVVRMQSKNIESFVPDTE